MDLGGSHRILKIVRVAVAFAAENKPCLRVLMHEQRRKRPDVAKAIVFERGSFPGIPGFDPQGISGGSQSQQIHHHQFAVVVPADRQKTDFQASIRVASIKIASSESQVQSTRLKISYARRLISEC